MTSTRRGAALVVATENERKLVGFAPAAPPDTKDSSALGARHEEFVEMPNFSPPGRKMAFAFRDVGRLARATNRIFCNSLGCDRVGGWSQLALRALSARFGSVSSSASMTR